MAVTPEPCPALERRTLCNGFDGWVFGVSGFGLRVFGIVLNVYCLWIVVLGLEFGV